MDRLKLGVTVAPRHLAALFRGIDMRDAAVVMLTDSHREASGLNYVNDDLPWMLSALDPARGAIGSGRSRDEFASILAPDGTRNAVEAALRRPDRMLMIA
ncbi:MAG: hypothetical protein P0Y64_16395 [Candidatus Sphingomonas colombiensis]|nr:hypothetical protein [Sphingomonas sp.]WEK42904.1 MAG: hypothetical protein P0Y64_16395 [Sphingomonas sp.]